jgi:hypothetical protein
MDLKLTTKNKTFLEKWNFAVIPKKVAILRG